MKEFEYDFAEMGEFFSTSWSSKSLEFEKVHDKEIDEELRLENLTSNKLEITIKDHTLLKHPKKVILDAKEVKHIVLKIPCGDIKGKHNSVLVLESKNQKEEIPIKITHKD